MLLQDKIALVTGAASGIGRATAHHIRQAKAPASACWTSSRTSLTRQLPRSTRDKAVPAPLPSVPTCATPTAWPPQ